MKGRQVASNIGRVIYIIVAGTTKSWGSNVNNTQEVFDFFSDVFWAHRWNSDVSFWLTENWYKEQGESHKQDNSRYMYMYMGIYMYMYAQTYIGSMYMYTFLQKM